ncbi:MAG: hypothetical protein DME96_05025 [Verrucomicrobia bacterium]|nr:MAG: hypothetical protein DME96_05025 [Verrucomicrobiota bacterium]
MNSLTIGFISAGCIFGGVLLGMLLQKVLPQHHLESDSKDTVKLGAGMLATLTALVLGLLVSSAKGSFDAMNAGIAQTGAKVILFDHILADYGPETKEVREQLRDTVASTIEKIWPDKKGGPGGLRALESVDAAKTLQAKLRELTPKNDLQKSLLAQASQIGSDVLQTRLLLMEGQQNTLPASFLVLLIFWLTGLFISFGLFAPRNGTVLAVLLICALSVSSAIFLILEMNRPLDGFIKASNAPLRKAVELIGK